MLSYNQILEERGDSFEERLHAARGLSKLANDIIFQKASFETATWPDGVDNWQLQAFLHYQNELPASKRNAYVQVIQEITAEHFHQGLNVASEFSRSPGFGSDYDQFGEINRWLRERSGKYDYYGITGPWFPPALFDVNKIITQTFKNRGYIRSKSAPMKGMRAFCRSVRPDNFLYLGFERGNLRTFMSLWIGLDHPLFMTDVGAFFFLGQSRFDFVYVNKSVGMVHGEKKEIHEYLKPRPENVVEITNKGIDLAEQLLPHVLERVKP